MVPFRHGKNLLYPLLVAPDAVLLGPHALKNGGARRSPMRRANMPPIAMLSPVGRRNSDSSVRSPLDSRSSDQAKPTHRRRDPDAARMTAYSMPEPMATTQAPKTTGHISSRQSAKATEAPRSASMYWMPDHLCKSCYDCGASFTVFRRRHHCRLCGQIFCHNCSSQFVDGTLHGFPNQMIRICKFCSRYVTADAERKQQAATEVRRRASLDAASSPLLQSVPAIPPESTPVEKTSPLLFSPMSAVEAAAIPLPEDDAPMDRISDELEQEIRAGIPEEISAPTVALYSIESTESIDFPEDHQEPADGKSFRRPSLMRRRRSSLEFLNGQSTLTAGDLEPAQLVESESTESALEATLISRPSLELDSDSFRVKNDLHTQREIILDKYMKAAHDRIKEGIQRSVDRSIKHFASDGVEVKRLVSSLEDMAFIVTGHLLFSMKFRTPNGFNFDELVKVKSIATPMEANSSRQLTKDPYSFKWLAGCVCRKQLSHKQMARRIDNPRILLLACAISYDRSSDKGKMSSLDALIESEQSYMAILVRKISKLEPDIIFVERTVSRYAQEFLQQLGVAIVLNVKHETLERIGRYTGAMVLPSVDHVDQVNPEEAIGRCRSFYAQTVPIAPEDGPDTPAAPAPSAANGEGHITYQRSSSNAGRAKNETYLYLDGCDPLNGCTVLITGPSKKKLGVMKTLMRNVLSMTYRTLLEAHVLSGLDLSFIDWYRHSLADQLDRVTWCTTCTLRQYETVEGKLRYYQCSGSKRIGIAPYANEDISLGNFLAKEMEALSYRCSNPKCGFTMVDHVQTFSCTAGTVTVSFEELPDSTDASSANGSYVNVLSLLGNESGTAPPTSPEEEDEECPTIVYGKWCIECAKMVCPFAPLKKYAYKFSLARLLEILLSDSHPESVTLEGEVVPELTPTCPHNFMKSHVLFFNVGRIVARMDFAMRKPLRLFNTPSTVVIDGKRRRRAVAQCLLSNTGEESSLVAVAAASRTEMLMSLLDKLMELFSDKVGNVEEVVLSCQDQDEVATDVLIEIAFVKKLIDSECLSFSQRIAAIGGEPSANKQLAETDHVKRALYYAVCGWIEEMQKLRRLIRAKLAIEPDNSVAASPFSLSGFSFSTPTSMSPASSPRRSRPSSKEGYLEERDRSRASSSAQSFNGAPEDRNSLYAASSPGVSLQPKLAKSVSVQSAPAGSQKIDSKESGWRGMLWDIYRAVGKSTPGDDLDLPLPVELLEGHPSLSSRSNDCTFLVNEMVPITSVAYALASQSYDEQLEAWKISLQARSSTNGLSPTAEAKIESSNSSSSTEWTRSALSTSTHMHFKHTVVDTPRHIGLMFPSGSGSTGCWEFSTIAFFPLQFEALRELFYGNLPEYLFSISHVNNWAALGGKSGASFYRTLDDRFVVKHISSTEQQSFLEVLPSYFDYMSKVFHDEAASVISKTFGMYQTTITRKDTGQRTTHHIVVMENAFYGQTITKTFDLKGSSRNRYVKPDADGKPRAVELDGNFVEMTEGHPMGVIAEDHELLLSAIENDSAFLTSINIVDFSLVLGLGGNTPDLPNVYTKMTVGIIDYMRQFDLMKRVESVSKSVAMIAGQSSPTIIEPALYSKRFSDAVRRYFMPVTPIDSDRNDPYIASR